MTIILSRSGQDARRIESRRIEKEDFVQRYIYENPQAIPLTEIRDDLRLCILPREFPTWSGPVDVLAVADEGFLYLIGTKLYRNPDKRRVLAQVLACGASLWKQYGNPGEFVPAIDERVQKERGLPIATYLATELDLEEEGVDELVEAMKACAGDSGFRFVILMDQLEDRLRNLISFMNQNSRFDVFGVDIDYYEEGELEILIPQLHGAEVRKEVNPPGRGTARRWDEEAFLGDASNRLEGPAVEALREMYTWSVSRADSVSWGRGKKKGSASFQFDRTSQRSVFTLWSNGDLQFNLKWLTDAPEGFTVRLVTALGSSLRFAEDAVDAYPNFKVEDWGAKVSEIGKGLSEVLEKER